MRQPTKPATTTIADTDTSSGFPKLLTPIDAAEILQVDIQLLNQWRSARRGPRFVKIGRFVRYRATDLEAWIDRQEVKTELKLV